MYAFLHEHMLPFLWDERPETYLLGDVAATRLVLNETADLPSRVALPFCIPASDVGDLQFLHICSSIWCCDDFAVFALLLGAER